MPVFNLFWAVIILFLTQNVICFVPSRQINVPGISQGSVPFPLQDAISSEESGRPVYDPGDDFLKHQPIDETIDYNDISNEVDFNDRMFVLQKLEQEIREDQDVARKSELLMKMIEDPNIQTLPVIYVEETPVEMTNIIPTTMEKRSRYYRRYPWKRQNSRNRPNYEADTRYLCVPSREDVFKLLVGLHENRKGNQHKTVNFCNRKRPAKAIFTNIRFLG